MKPSLLKYSAWISLVCVLCLSCRSSRILSSGDEAGKMRESFLSSSFEKITCKARVTFHENEFSGLILIKNTGDGNYKMAFYNELGMTFLEGLIDNQRKHTKLVIKNIIPDLNHKSFIKSFERSTQLLFSEKTQPISKSSNPPRFPASPLPTIAEDILIVQLKNGFSLELKPE